MSQEALGRLAASCIVAVIGSITLMAVCKNPVKAMSWWLVYAVASGVVLNTKKGEGAGLLAISAAAPAVVPLIAISYVWFIVHANTCFSAMEPDSDGLWLFFAFFFSVSWVGIFLFSFSRSITFRVARFFGGTRAKGVLERTEASIRALIAVILALAMLFQKVATL